MSSKNKTEFIKLSKLIKVLEAKSYYRVFAKTFVTAFDDKKSDLSEKAYIKEMFILFIRQNELKIYYNESEASLEFINSEINRRSLEKISSKANIESIKELERNLIWDNEIFINANALKKLYANKCIVFPNALIAQCAE